MAYNLTAKSLCVKDEEEIDTLIKEYTSKSTAYALGLIEEELIDDVEYNQKWWKWYCQENKLEVTTGKSLNSRFLYCNPLF